MVAWTIVSVIALIAGVYSIISAWDGEPLLNCLISGLAALILGLVVVKKHPARPQFRDGSLSSVYSEGAPASCHSL